MKSCKNTKKEIHSDEINAMGCAEIFSAVSDQIFVSDFASQSKFKSSFSRLSVSAVSEEFLKHVSKATNQILCIMIEGEINREE